MTGASVPTTKAGPVTVLGVVEVVEEPELAVPLHPAAMKVASVREESASKCLE